MTDPVVSVIVKSYNRPWLLRVCLESIATFWPRERFPNYEVIVADDGTEPHLWTEVERRYGGDLMDFAVHNDEGEKKWPLCREGRFGEVVPTCGQTWNEAHEFARGRFIFLIEDDSYLIRPSSPSAMANILHMANSDQLKANLMCVIGLRERLELDVHGISERDRVTEPPQGAELLAVAGRVAELVRACPACTAAGHARAIDRIGASSVSPPCGACFAAVTFAVAEAKNRPSPLFMDAMDVHGNRETVALLRHPIWPWSFDGIMYRKSDWDEIGPWPTTVATGPMEHFVQTRLRELGWLTTRKYGLAPDPFCCFDAQTSCRTDYPSTYAGRFRHVDAVNAAWLARDFDPSFEDVRTGRLPWDRTRTSDPMRLHYRRDLRQSSFVTGHELCGDLAGEAADARWLSQANQEAARYGEQAYESVPDACRSGSI